MKHFHTLLVFTFISVTAPLLAQTFTFDFAQDNQGWSGDFADYPVGDSVFYELEFIRTTLPAPLDTDKFALKISGNNHSDDLFMFIKRKITGLLPNTTYQLLIDVEFASNAPTNAFGVGGPPGEGVRMKAGAMLIEPLKVNDGGFYLMNIDKGNQSVGGVDMDTIGHVGVSDTTTVFALINRNNATHPFTITTDSNGECWVCIGTDSGFEATTTLYYNIITLTFTTTTDVDDVKRPLGLTVYPNPTTGTLIIKGADEITAMELYTMDGALIFRKTYADEKTVTTDLSGFEEGMYVLKVYCGEQLYAERIVVH